MLRPSPTSISLSATDLSFHFNHIDIYQGLLRDGFKKKDIQKFFKEQKAANIERVEAFGPEESLRAPTYTELIGRGSKPILVKAELTPTASNCLVGAKAVDDIQAAAQIESSSQPSTPDYSHRVVSSVSTKSYHAPRQSSLLRFSSNVSSDEQEHAQNPSHVPIISRSQLRYRPRTDTCSFEQSSPGSDSSSSSLITVFENIALDESPLHTRSVTSKTSQLRGDAEEFTPQNPACAVELQIAQPSAQISESFTTRGSRIIPRLHIQKNVQDSQNVGVLSNSPPLQREDLGSARNIPIESPTLPPMLFTPRTLRRVPNSRTEPRDARLRYLDGPSFTPYDDSLPAGVQPQTPADLARQPLVSELNATYTAQPGRLRNDTITNRHGLSTGVDPDDESPTNRAIHMRQRRNREYARSARIEGLRISRLQGRFSRRSGAQARFDAWMDEEHYNLWRDDLDADRVGEENFQDTDNLADTRSNGIRVVSGNMRANGA